MRAAVYLRNSAGLNGHEPDVEHQRADCLSLAGRLGADVVEVYSDDDPVVPVGTSERRPAYRRMLTDAATRRFGTVIAYTSRRLAEQPGEYEDLIELAQRYGIRFAYVRPAAADPGSGSAGPLVPVVGAVNTFRRLAGDLAPDLKGLLSDAAPAIEPLADGAAAFVRNAMPGLRVLARESTPFLAGVGRSLPTLGQALGTFLSNVSPGAQGASVLADDVAVLASGQAAFWGDVVRRMSQTYLTARDVASDVDQAFASLPLRARYLVMRLFDRVTTALGVGIGWALRSPAGAPDRVAWPTAGALLGGLPAVAGVTGSAVSALFGAASDLLAALPVRVGRTAGDLAGAARSTGALIRDEGRAVVNGIAGGARQTTGLAAAAVDRAGRNILLGVRNGLASPPVAGAALRSHRPGLAAAGPIPDRILAAAAPAGVPAGGLHINLYGVWDLTDADTFDRVATGVYEALNRYRRDHP